MSDLFDKNGLALADCTVSVCNYSATGEYLSTTSEFIKQGVGLPACATLVAAPDVRSGYARVFDGTSGTWSYSEDHRGTTVYSVTTGAAITLTALGPIDATLYTTTKPAPPVAPLTQQAAAALNTARTYVMNNYYLLGEAVPTEWIAYQKSLIAISNGTDTKSTALPSAPTS